MPFERRIDYFIGVSRALPPRFCGVSIFLAHARSLCVSGPPVALETSSTIALNSLIVL